MHVLDEIEDLGSGAGLEEIEEEAEEGAAITPMYLEGSEDQDAGVGERSRHRRLVMLAMVEEDGRF